MLDIQDAISLLEQREPREAVRLLEPMVDEMPAYVTARVLLARSYEALNEWDQALRVWREALHLIPNSPVVRRGLARAAARGAGRRGRPHVATEDTAPTPPPSIEEPPASDSREDTPSYEPPESDLEPVEHSADRAEASYDPDPAPPSRPTSETRDPQPRPTSDANEPRTPNPERKPTNDERGTPHRQDIPLPTHFPPDRREPPDYAPPSQRSRQEKEAADEFDELQELGDTGTPHYEDLDRLINELESARIVPRPDLDEMPSPDLEDDIEDVVSETLARIYASQGQYDEAARVYELLAGQHPEEADEYMQKASQMRSRASDGD